MKDHSQRRARRDDASRGEISAGDSPASSSGWSPAFLDHLEDYAIFMVDPEGRIVRWNRGAETVTGYTADEVLGRPFSIFYAEDEARNGKIGTEMRVALETGRYAEERWRYKADGTPFFANEILLPVHDGAGHHLGFAKIFRDLTNEHLTQEELLATEIRLRLALEAAGLGDWELDLRTRMSPHRSLRHDRIFGYRHGVDEWGYDRFMEHVHPADRATVDERFHKALASGEPWDFECRITRTDGEERWVWAKGVIHYDTHGEPDRAFGMIMDVTERKRSSESIRVRARQQEAVAQLGQRALAGRGLDTLFDDAVHLLHDILDLDYAKVLELLPGRRAFRLRTGVGWDDGLLGETMVSAGPDSQAGYTLRSEEPVVVDDLRTEQRFSGPRLLVEHGVVSGMSVIIGSVERPWGVLGVHTREPRRFSADDVHFLQAVANVLAGTIERVRAEEALRVARDAAEAASRAKSDFLAVMSHELRTPLTAVIGYADLIDAGLAGPVTDAQRQRLGRIKASARHLVGLIEEILTFSRTESDREIVVPTDVDLVALARQSVDAVRANARAKRLELRAELPDSPVSVRTDPDKVRRILVALLENAVSFTREGTIVLEMEATAHEVRLRVRDTGIGIPPAQREKIFEPFWQAEGALTRQVGGTGLGLTVARRLVRMLGGRISLASAVGRGSTFTVTLPRSRQKADG